VPNAHCPGVDCRSLGFDGTLVFEPQLGALPGFRSERASLAKLRRNLALRVLSPRLKIYDYTTARNLMAQRQRDFPVHPCILVGWDNTPRRGHNGIVLVNSTPDRFEAALREAVTSIADKPPEHRLVFLNAWNEWAEGNHLEPDQKYGRAYLDAISTVTKAR